MTITIASAHRYPLKSAQGESVESLDLVASGALGDRAWAVRDEVRGGIRGAKKIASLMNLAARFVEEPTPANPTPAIKIGFPNGESCFSTDADCARLLSEALDHEVTLWPLQPAEDLDHYRRGAPDSEDFMEELRDIFGRTESEPLPDFSIFPPEILEFESPPGTYLDAFPLLLATNQSLEQLANLCPDSQIDMRRFRPNLVVDTTQPGLWPEFEWVGRRMQLGSALLEITAACPRCVMVTRGFADLAQDRTVLRRDRGRGEPELWRVRHGHHQRAGVCW
jgi:uncharacterized protein YcbX